VVIEDQATIPGWVSDLESFRRWTRADDYPERGESAYLQNVLWVDLSPEELWSHNQVKVAFAAALESLNLAQGVGLVVGHGMRLSAPAAELSVEPDLLFFRWATLESGRLRLVEGARGGVIELEGTPDVVLEIVSASSVAKDTVRLRELYARAEVPEYWLVDARGETPHFEILRHTPAGYVPAEADGDWQTSAVFGHAFRLIRRAGPLGHPLFVVESRPV
jgi:Uma2 family endonuclease